MYDDVGFKNENRERELERLLEMERMKLHRLRDTAGFNFTMKLPGIRLASTPVIIPHSSPPSRQSRCMMVTSLALPKISHVTQSWKDFQSLPRLNPLHPPMVPKRTVCLETLAVHHHNQQRSLCMQRKEHYTYHQGWRKPFYGTSSEREDYRKDIREQLKKQIEEKGVGLRLQLASKVKEADYMRDEECRAVTRDREECIKHSRAMTLYRDENKKLMEQTWRDRALTRSLGALEERELLRLNPINWSGTLK
ncbi:unnamed protein product [Boreogadus saida]